MRTGFLWFFPGSKGGLSREQRDSLKAVAPFGVKTIQLGPEHSPTDTAGVLAIRAEVRPARGRHAYRPEDQLWFEGKDYWVGHWQDEAPESYSLQRPAPTGVEFRTVRLGDGGYWELPIVGTPPEHLRLPVKWVERADSIRCEVLVEFQHLVDHAEQIQAQILAPDDKVLTDGEFYRICCDALAVRYYVSSAEVSLLQLLQPKCYGDIMLALLGAEREALIGA